MSSLKLFLFASLLLTGCASTGQLAGAGCTYNLCGQLCCANDGKACPLCYFDSSADTGCYWLPGEDEGHLIIEGEEFEDDRGICESLKLR
jgi:hypothetical protein